MSKITQVLRSVTALILAFFVFLDGAGLILAGLWAVGPPATSYRLPTSLIAAASGVVMSGYFIPWFTKEKNRYLTALFGLLLGLGSGLYLFGPNIPLVPWTSAAVLLSVIGSVLPHPRLQAAFQNQSPILRADHIFETVLYASNLGEMERFYKKVLGLDTVRSSEQMLAFRCRHGVLLVFDPQKSRLPDRDLPSHGSSEPGHLAFAVADAELDAWRSRLVENDVEIEGEVDWEEGGRSIYFRDPTGNSLELASPQLWGGGWEIREN
jgi:catechol 2,3-dioxygenase-like lactoylglutathione lyase family enzyme